MPGEGGLSEVPVEHPTRPPSNADLFARLDRIEDLLTRRLDKIEGKVDASTSRLDKLEGGIGMLKWLGPTGVAALIFGLGKSVGLF